MQNQPITKPGMPKWLKVILIVVFGPTLILYFMSYTAIFVFGIMVNPIPTVIVLVCVALLIILVRLVTTKEFKNK